jgi:hypothetical protein
LDGIRTRGSQGPDDSQGRRLDMAHERGAFKVNRLGVLVTGYEPPQPFAGNLDNLEILNNY